MATLKEQLDSYSKGIIIDSDGDINRCFNFYDWFCKDSSLENKAKKLFKQLKIFLKYYPEINLDKTYCFFKNNCPVFGSLYDDFRICDIETGNVIFCVVPKTGHKSLNNRAEIWGKENDFNEPLKIAETYNKLF